VSSGCEQSEQSRKRTGSANRVAVALGRVPREKLEDPARYPRREPQVRVFWCRQQFLATEAAEDYDGHGSRARRVVGLDHRRDDAALGQRELGSRVTLVWEGGSARANAIRRRWSMSWSGSLVNATSTTISAAHLCRTGRSHGALERDRDRHHWHPGVKCDFV
jgi:hypothetical protein